MQCLARDCNTFRQASLSAQLAHQHDQPSLLTAMLTVQDAETRVAHLVRGILNHSQSSVTETTSLTQSIGLVLAQTVASPLDFPHWDNSAMDGYAVRADDIASVTSDNPAVLPVVMEVAAGQVPQRSLHPGEAARIFTGAMLPDGADCIVMQENTAVVEADPEATPTVQILQTAEPGNFIRRKGSFHQAGQTLLEPGVRLQAPEIAVLAAAQIAQLEVFAQPNVGLLSTGNELVDIDKPMGPGQIVDSNGYALAAAVKASGAIAHPLDRLRDDRDALRAAIAAVQANPNLDVVLSTGGVSVGDYDYVDEILTELGATLHVRSVAVKPGKPLTVATLPRPNVDGPPLLYFGLPGNPVSALVSFWRFVQPALRQMSGLQDWQPQFVKAIAETELRSGGQRETYLWGKLRWEGDGYRFAKAGGSHSSGNLINLAGTNGLAKLSVGTKAIAAGEQVEVLVPHMPR